ncbi:MAG TPA: D-alanine--D-alanine ligase [Cellvibrionaceae bacterium]
MMHGVVSQVIDEQLKQALGVVGVLYGGQSAEREISLQSGAAIIAALKTMDIPYVALDIGKNSIANLQSAGIDRAFIALHGPGGEDGRIQAVLEYMEIPYTGSDVQSSAIAMDKLRTKQLWCGTGVSTPAFSVLQANSDWQQILEALGGDVMVKPAHEGSSIGMSRVSNANELASAFEAAERYDASVIAERLIVGAEYTVAILGDEALAPIKLETDHRFYDFEAKYLADDTRYLCPCGLSAEKITQLKAQALHAFRQIGCKGWGRVDVMADAAGEFYMLEVNTVPGMTSHSLVPMAAKACGMTFEQLILKILEHSICP